MNKIDQTQPAEPYEYKKSKAKSKIIGHVETDKPFEGHCPSWGEDYTEYPMINISELWLPIEEFIGAIQEDITKDMPDHSFDNFACMVNECELIYYDHIKPIFLSHLDKNINDVEEIEHQVKKIWELFGNTTIHRKKVAYYLLNCIDKYDIVLENIKTLKGE